MTRAHPDARARAVLRAARHAVQRVPPHQGARRAGPPDRPGDLPHWPRRGVAEPAHLPRPAPPVRSLGAYRALADEGGARHADALHGAAAGLQRAVRRHSLARGDGPGGRVAGAVAGHSAPLRHALEPAAAVGQLQLQRVVVAAAAVHVGRRGDGAPVARGDHHLPGVAGHRLRDGRGRPRAAHRERDGRRCRRAGVEDAGRDSRRMGRAGRCAAGALHRHLRGLPGRGHAD